MKKTYRLENLDCANCAAKIERALQKLEGVVSASVNFMSQRMSLECADGAEAEVLSRAKAAIYRLEPDVTVK